MTILLLGATGQVGWELQRSLAPLGALRTPGRGEAELARPDTLRACVNAAEPRLIVNAAAFTAVDQAESEEGLATTVNGTAPGVLAALAAQRSIPLVHYSTDYVFDGSLAGAYRESDATQPLNAYGRSKLAGETAILASGAAHLIFRTSWVYGARGRNFLRTMLRLGAERERLQVVDDQVGAPTWSRMIAQATALVLAQCRAPDGSFHLGERAGLYHLSAGGSASWCEFARAIFFDGPQRGALKVREVLPIPSAEYPTPARRPANSRLDCSALREAFGIALPGWRVSLHQVLEDLAHAAE